MGPWVIYHHEKATVVLSFFFLESLMVRRHTNSMARVSHRMYHCTSWYQPRQTKEIQSKTFVNFFQHYHFIKTATCSTSDVSLPNMADHKDLRTTEKKIIDGRPR